MPRSGSRGASSEPPQLAASIRPVARSEFDAAGLPGRLAGDAPAPPPRAGCHLGDGEAGVVVCVVDPFSAVGPALVQLAEVALSTKTHEREATWNDKTYCVREGGVFVDGGKSILVTIVELSEDFFDSDGPAFRWPEGIPQPHGVLQCYDVTKKKTLLNCPELLDAFAGLSIPTILVGCNADCPPESREFEQRFAAKLGRVFGVSCVEVASAADAQEVFCAIIRLAAQKRELTRPTQTQTRYSTYKRHGQRLPLSKEHGPTISTLVTVQKTFALSVPLPDESFHFTGEATLRSIPALTSELGKWHGPEMVEKVPAWEDADEEVQFVTARESNDGQDAAAGPSEDEKEESVQTAADERLERLLTPDASTVTPLLSPVSPVSPLTFPNYAGEEASAAEPDVPNVIPDARPSSPPRVKPAPPAPVFIRTQVAALQQGEETLTETKEQSPTAAMADILADLEQFTADLIGQRPLDVPLLPEDVSVAVNPQEAMVANAPLGNGVTLQQLVDKITSPTHSDMHSTKAFLLMYRRFARPRALLDALLERFDAADSISDEQVVPAASPVNVIQLRVCNVLIHWCSEYWNDFRSEQTRFTLHVLLEICSCRRGFMAICRVLEPLFLQPPPAEDIDANWGLTDVQEDAVRWTERAISPGQAYPKSANPAPPPSSRPTADPVPAAPRQRRKSDFDALLRSDEALHIKDSSASSFPAIAPPASANSAEARQSPESASSAASAPPPGGWSARRSRPRFDSGGTTAGSRKTHRMHASLSLSSLRLPRDFGVVAGDEVDPARRTAKQLLSHSEEAIAEQLTLLEFQLFSKIKSRDLLKYVLGTRKGDDRGYSPTVTALVRNFNYVSSWTANLILMFEKTKTRSKILEKLMNVAVDLCKLHNYNTFMAVVSGMNSAAVFRMRATFDGVSRSVVKAFREAETVMSPAKSFANYRHAMITSALPCIPYLPVFLSDMLYMQEANSDYVDQERELVNWPKFMKMGESVTALMRYQHSSYPFTLDPDLTNLILGQPLVGEQALYERSLLLEPRKPRK